PTVHEARRGGARLLQAGRVPPSWPHRGHTPTAGRARTPLARGSCPCSLRLNTRGLLGDRRRSKKMPSIEPSWHLRSSLPLVTSSQPAVRTHVACSDQLP